jgi:glycosyltransferase involved in cell wall biosynthesis
MRLLPSRPAEVAGTVLFSLWLAVRLVRGQYDVYHFHGGWWSAVLPALLARALGKPFILKVTQLGDDDPQTAVNKRVGPIPIGGVYSLPFRFASALIAMNPEIARLQRECFPDAPALATSNGVEVDRFRVTAEERARARQELDLPEDSRVVLFVGHINPRKGVQELIEAWLEFVSTRPAGEPPYRLLLVGPTTGGAYRHVAADTVALAESPDVQEAGVRLLGHVPGEAMPSLYAAVDAFILPTYAEGMPNSLLEALAAGLPAISTRVPGVEEILAQDDKSVLMEGVSAAEIARALERVLSSLESTESADRRSRLPASFGLPGVADGYVRLYRALAAGDGRAARRAFQEPQPDFVTGTT